MEKIVLIDFAGTLVKAEIIEEANELRSSILKKALPSKEEHANSESLYKVNREFVEKLTGLSVTSHIKYRNNDLDFMMMTGEQVQNQIAATLFQMGMYMSAQKHKKDVFPKGFLEQLKRMKKLGYKLAIVSGVRTDIITGVFAIAEFDVEFDYIYGQPAMLGHDQDLDLKDLHSKGKVEFVIGDKLDDLQRFGLENTKKIFVKWGHAMGGEEAVADFSIESANELSEIIK